MAEEALALHLAGMAEDEEPIPEPSSLEAAMADRENRDAVAILVSAPPTTAKAVRVNMTMPEDELERIDHFAAEQGYTRSGFLLHAAKRAMGEPARLTAVEDPLAELARLVEFSHVTGTAGTDHRHRDRNGHISKRHGDTKIKTLRKVYGANFAKGHPGDETLASLLHELDEPSRATLVRDLKAGKLEVKIAGRTRVGRRKGPGEALARVKSRG